MSRSNACSNIRSRRWRISREAKRSGRSKRDSGEPLRFSIRFRPLRLWDQSPAVPGVRRRSRFRGEGRHAGAFGFSASRKASGRYLELPPQDLPECSVLASEVAIESASPALRCDATAGGSATICRITPARILVASSSRPASTRGTSESPGRISREGRRLQRFPKHGPRPCRKTPFDLARAPLLAGLVDNFQHHGIAVAPPEGKQRGIRPACCFNGEAPGAYHRR